MQMTAKTTPQHDHVNVTKYLAFPLLRWNATGSGPTTLSTHSSHGPLLSSPRIRWLQRINIHLPSSFPQSCSVLLLPSQQIQAYLHSQSLYLAVWRCPKVANLFIVICDIAVVEMAGAAQNNGYTLLLAAIMVVMMISSVSAAEADVPSPSPITGAAYLAVAPSLAVGFVGSFIAFLACLFY